MSQFNREFRMLVANVQGKSGGRSGGRSVNRATHERLGSSRHAQSADNRTIRSSIKVSEQ
jgi:hypothetical protein